jgi:uncharacterized protein (TIGR00288 family)
MAESNVAVLIDYENVGLDSIEYLLDQLTDVGRLIIKRAYADWSVQRHKRDQLLELGIEAMHHFRSTKSGKNSSDISLTIDAVDLLYNAPVDAFVIVSSDSDFVPLVSKLRSAGKIAIGAGRREGSSPTLVKSCDRYIFLDDSKPTTKRKEKPRSRQAESESLVVRATEASMDDQGQVVGSKLYQTMVRIDPSFNFKALGHRNFTQFLSSSKEVRVDRPTDASDVIVSLNNSREPESVNVAEAEVVTSSWDKDIGAAWSRRQRTKISGQAAAADAAKVLGVPRLSVSGYPSLDKLLAASEFLRSTWRRERNTIIKKS